MLGLVSLPSCSYRTAAPRVDRRSTQQNTRHGCRLLLVQASSSDGFKEFQKRASEWAAEQKLDEKVAAAGKVTEESLRKAADVASSTFTKLDSEYRLADKAAASGRKIQEAWRDVDQEWGVRRKLRSLSEDFQKQLPALQAKAKDFLETTPGQVSAVLLVLFILQLPIFWTIFNAFLFLTVASYVFQFVVILLLGAQIQAEADEAVERGEPEFDPLVEAFRAAASAAPVDDTKGRAAGWKSDGPVIDAEFTVLKSNKD